MVHIGAAIASSLTWMHGRFPTHRRDGSRRYSSPYLQNISKFTQRAWPFVSSTSHFGVAACTTSRPNDYEVQIYLRVVNDS